MLSSQFNYDLIPVVGPQGSGKGTQLKKLEQLIGENVGCFAMSAILKHYYEVDPKFKDAQSLTQSRGELIGDDVIVSRLRMFMNEKFRNVRAVVADGYPRTPSQAFALEGIACRHFGQNARVASIVLEIDHELALKRCLKRAEDAKKGIGEIRDDDRPDLIEKRLRLYFDNLPGVISALHTFADVYEIDATQSPEDVHDQLVSCLAGRVKPLKPI